MLLKPVAVAVALAVTVAVAFVRVFSPPQLEKKIEKNNQKQHEQLFLQFGETYAEKNCPFSAFSRALWQKKISSLT